LTCIKEPSVFFCTGLIGVGKGFLGLVNGVGSFVGAAENSKGCAEKHDGLEKRFLHKWSSIKNTGFLV